MHPKSQTLWGSLHFPALFFIYIYYVDICCGR